MPNSGEPTCIRTVQQIFACRGCGIEAMLHLFERSRAQKHRASCLAGGKMTGMNRVLFCS